MHISGLCLLSFKQFFPRDLRGLFVGRSHRNGTSGLSPEGISQACRKLNCLLCSGPQCLDSEAPRTPL